MMALMWLPGESMSTSRPCRESPPFNQHLLTGATCHDFGFSSHVHFAPPFSQNLRRGGSVDSIDQESPKKVSSLQRFKDTLRRRIRRLSSVQRSQSLDDFHLATGFRLRTDGESRLIEKKEDAPPPPLPSSSSAENSDGEEMSSTKTRNWRRLTFRKGRLPDTGGHEQQSSYKIRKSSSCGDLMLEVSSSIAGGSVGAAVPARRSPAPAGIHRVQSVENLFKTRRPSKPRGLEDALRDFGAAVDLNSELKSTREHMPSSWRDFVAGCETMSKGECELQEAIWEAIAMELSYVQIVQTLAYFFRALETVQKAQYLPNVDGELLFGNIGEIKKSANVFWFNHLRQVYCKAKDQGTCLDSLLLANSFSSMSDLLKPYVKFCSQQSDRQAYFASVRKENGKFSTFLQWCQDHEACNRHDLSGLLVRPVQQLTRYELLLTEIHRKASKIAPEALHPINEKYIEMKKFVFHVNNAKFVHEERAKLQQIMASLEGYVRLEGLPLEAQEYLESSNKLDLLADIPRLPPSVCRMRILRHDSHVSTVSGWKHGSSREVSAHLYLFTDFLLLTGKQKNRPKEKQKIIKQPMPIEKVDLKMLSNEASFLLTQREDFGFVVNAVWINAQSPAKARIWEIQLQEAKDHLIRLRAGKAKSLFHQADVICPLPSSPPNRLSPNDAKRRRSGLVMVESDQGQLVVPESSDSVVPAVNVRHHRSGKRKPSFSGRPLSISSTFSQFSFNSVSSGFISTCDSSSEEDNQKENGMAAGSSPAQPLDVVHHSHARATLPSLGSVKEDSSDDVTEDVAKSEQLKPRRIDLMKNVKSKSLDGLDWPSDAGSIVV
eukprot:m.78618 g.78618  ORF g.78618 m.78618 type:complete len:830 (+) comp36108_c0_seq1:1838-4327(+)